MSAGIAYDKRKGVLALALKQGGSEASLKAALRARDPAAKDNSAGILKVRASAGRNTVGGM